MDEFTRIQTFIRVVEAGSFSAAARDLSSISSVARQVKALEDELGVRLLNRSTRSLSLTEPGRRFYERACGIANDLGNAKSEAKSFQDSVKGALRVSIRVSAATTMIVPALPAFMAQYPDLTVDITLSDERRDLVANNIDVAVWMGHLPDSEVVARRLSPSQRIVCGAPAYFDRHGLPQTPADLREHNCLLYTARSYGTFWAFTRDGQQEEIDVRGSLRTDNALVLLSAAVSGLGLVVVHEWSARSQIAQGGLTRVLGDYTVNPRPGDAELYAVYASSRGLSRKVRVFVDFLVDLFQGSGSADASVS
jgi:DNA-binding transcriptional LysR family regulator